MSTRIELADCENVLLREIADKRLKQADVALTFAMAMASSEEVNWPRVNEAIIERWSISGLRRVKEMAWKRFEGRE
jgi:threonine synthase